MRAVERYIWGKTECGYGWLPWKPTEMCIERDGQRGYWGVYNPDGSQICLCVDRRSAERVLRRLWRAERAVFRISGTQQVALLRKTRKRWVFNTFDSHVDYGESFSSREQAEKFIQRE